jgi:hypothetical protein
LGPSLPVFTNWQRLGGYAQLTLLYYMLLHRTTATPFCAKPLIMPQVLRACQSSCFSVDILEQMQLCYNFFHLTAGTPYA